MFTHGGGGNSPLAKRIINLKTTELKDIMDGIDYSILDDFVRVLKEINIFIWCSKNQIPTILNYFLQYDVQYEILVWLKQNPTPMTNNTWLPDVEYCLWFKGKGRKLNDGYELKSKWYISPINKKDKDKFSHPTCKPVELIKRHLLHTTQPGDVVLDPFAGSGSTCVACKETQRHYLGIEIEKRWWQVSNNRLNNQDDTGQFSMFTF